jgi:hypothetical protein
MALGFDRRKLMGKFKKLKNDIGNGGAGSGLDDEHEYSMRIFSRLAKTFNFHDAATNLYHCILGTIVNEAPQRLLFFTFSIDGQLHKHLAEFAQKFGLAVNISGRRHQRGRATSR